MSVTSGGTAPKPCRSGGSTSASAASGGIVAVFSPPRPNGTFQISGIDDDAEKTVFPRGIVGRPHLKRHLVIGVKINRLHIAARPQIPKMDLMPIFVGQQIFRNDAVLKLRWQGPFTRHHVVAGQVPPEIIVKLLRSPIDFPTAENIESLTIHNEDARRSIGAVASNAAQSALK